MKHHTRDTGEPFPPLVFNPPFKSLLLFNEMLHNKTDWRKQLVNHPVMKAKDVNCLPALLHMTNLPSDPHLAGEDTQRSKTPGLTWSLGKDQTNKQQENRRNQTSPRPTHTSHSFKT